MINWLWLEDQKNTVADLLNEVEQANLNVKFFQNPSEMINYILDKRKKDNILKNMGLILDVLLPGQEYITSPAEWLSGTEPIFYPTKNGYDAGLVFYEKVIMNINQQEEVKPLWSPPPPVLFLTVLHTEHENIEQRINKLKFEWGKINKVEPDKVLVRWVRKWDATNGRLVKLLKEWEKELEGGIK